MAEFDELVERRAQLSDEIKQIDRRIREICQHDWKWSPIAGDGQYCPKCGAHNYDVDD